MKYLGMLTVCLMSSLCQAGVQFSAFTSEGSLYLTLPVPVCVDTSATLKVDEDCQGEATREDRKTVCKVEAILNRQRFDDCDDTSKAPQVLKFHLENSSVNAESEQLELVLDGQAIAVDIHR